MSVNTTVSISGMHCGHCVSSVTEELQELEGVQGVAVELNKDGISVATITSDFRARPGGDQRSHRRGGLHSRRRSVMSGVSNPRPHARH